MKLILVKLFLISSAFVACHANAEIFVCKDSHNKITYQDEPCVNTTIRTLKNVPDAPIEDQISAQKRVDKANALSLQRSQLAEAQRQQQGEADREYQALAIEKRKLELLEKQNLESEQSLTPQWTVGGGAGFGLNGFNSHQLGTNRLNPYRYGTHQFGTEKNIKRNYRNRDFGSGYGAGSSYGANPGFGFSINSGSRSSIGVGGGFNQYGGATYQNHQRPNKQQNSTIGRPQKGNQ